VPAQDDRALGGTADRLAARIDVGVEIAEPIAGFSATGQRHRDAGNSAVGEGLGHLSPPPPGVAHAGAVNEDQSRHRKAREVAGFPGELLPVTEARRGPDAHDWLPQFTELLRSSGTDEVTAQAQATLALTVIRGLMLDDNATGEQSRIDAAFSIFDGL
jgi:hypothetical protein